MFGELCICHRLAKRRCDCGEPLCETCYKKSFVCKSCVEKLMASTDESDAAQLAQWEREQEPK